MNISSLYKTAVTEVGRKDQQIKELNQKCVSQTADALVPIVPASA